MAKRPGFVVAACALAFAAMAAGPSARTQPPRAPKTVWDGVYSEEQATRGKDAYARECSACHGEDLTGTSNVPPLAGEPFMIRWNDAGVGDVFGRVRGMPLGAGGSLEPQTYLDIMAFILQTNGVPAGPDELARSTVASPRIKITRRQ